MLHQGILSRNIVGLSEVEAQTKGVWQSVSWTKTASGFSAPHHLGKQIIMTEQTQFGRTLQDCHTRASGYPDAASMDSRFRGNDRMADWSKAKFPGIKPKCAANGRILHTPKYLKRTQVMTGNRNP